MNTTLTLPAGQVLSVTASAFAAASVFRLGDKPGDDGQGLTSIAASGSATFGPYAGVTRWQIAAAVDATVSTAAVDPATDATVDALTAAYAATSSIVNGLSTVHLYGAGAPVNYTDGSPPATGEGVAPKGAIYTDTTNGVEYMNTGTQAQPTWTADVSAVAYAALAAIVTAQAALHQYGTDAPVNAVRASLSVNPAGDDNALTFTAVAYGTPGNSITIEYVDPAAFNSPLSVAVVGSAITVNLATGADPGAITSTAAEVKTAIEASGPASALVTVAIDTTDSGVADDGSGVVTAMASAPLTGGVGTAIGVAPPAALYSVVAGTGVGDVYRNDGTQAVPVWVKLADAV